MDMVGDTSAEAFAYLCSTVKQPLAREISLNTILPL